MYIKNTVSELNVKRMVSCHLFLWGEMMLRWTSSA